VTADVTLVLLPGLDGTDVFLRPLVAALSPAIRSMVVTYPTAGAEEYGDALDVVRRATAELSEFYVLGLSFSGPLAVMLAAGEPKRVKGVILVATFVRLPRPMLRFFRFACHGPTLWMWRILRRIPIWALRSRRDPLRIARAETLRAVPSRAFAGRVRAVLDIDVSATLRQCRQPILCISFANDLVVPRQNVDAILREVPAARHATVAGGHFTGCTNAGALATTVEAFLGIGAEGSR
jgi:pimeloyl-ACP methyl ester carboxylesterase